MLLLVWNKVIMSSSAVPNALDVLICFLIFWSFGVLVIFVAHRRRIINFLRNLYTKYRPMLFLLMLSPFIILFALICHVQHVLYLFLIRCYKKYCRTNIKVLNVLDRQSQLIEPVRRQYWLLLIICNILCIVLFYFVVGSYLSYKIDLNSRQYCIELLRLNRVDIMAGIVIGSCCFILILLILGFLISILFSPVFGFIWVCLLVAFSFWLVSIVGFNNLALLLNGLEFLIDPPAPSVFNQFDWNIMDDDDFPRTSSTLSFRRTYIWKN